MNLEELDGYELAGRFRLGRLLGQGGYGAVFEAEQLSVGRRCAVKILNVDLLSEDSALRRFEHEARATSRLTHPNTVVIYDFGRDTARNVVFLAMELLDGKSLDAVLAQRRTLAPRVAVHVARQAAESLDEAHERGLVHRDVKPQNMMLLERSGDPHFLKVIDFGIAKMVAGEPTGQQTMGLTRTGTIVGTPKYMSPEQVRDATLDGRSDQYSLAVCVYRMLTGRTPFGGASPVDVALRHVTDRPLPLTTVAPTLPVSGAFEAAVQRALAKEPEERFDDCRGFVRALEEALDEVDAAATRPAMETAMKTSITRDLRPPSEQTTEPMKEALETAPLPAPAPEPEPEPAPGLEPQSAVSIDDEPGHTLAVDVTPPPILPTEATEATAEVPEAMAPVAPTARADAETVERREGGLARVAVVVALLVGAIIVVAGLQIGAGGGEEVVEPVVERAVEPPSPPVEVTVEPPPVEEPAEPAVEEPAPAQAPEPEPEPEPEPAPAPAPAPDPPAQKAPRVARRGKVQVSLMPWGTLWVGGRKYGDEPVQELRLSAGRHTFRLEQNGVTRARKTVDVVGGQTKMIRLIAQ